jgi:hypothetical protein
MRRQTIGSFVVLAAVMTGLRAPAFAQQAPAAQSTSQMDSTRLFMMPTARTLPAGKGFVGVNQIIMPFFEVGVTNRVTVGAGAPVWVLYGGPFWVTARVQVIDRQSVGASVGVLHFATFTEQFGGIAYAATTIGGEAGAVTVAGGRVYSSEGAGPAYGMIGGNWRIGRKTRFVTENHIWREGGFLSGGIRYGGERFFADFGVTSPLFADYPPFPIVNFVWRF